MHQSAPEANVGRAGEGGGGHGAPRERAEVEHQAATVSDVTTLELVGVLLTEARRLVLRQVSYAFCAFYAF